MPLPETWGDPGDGGAAARRRRQADLDSKPWIIAAWLDGLIDTDYAVVLGSLDPDPAVRIWASELLALQVRSDPRSFVAFTAY